MKEQLNNIISWVALAAYYIPILIVIFRKLLKDVPIVLFACYWAVGGLINLMPHFLPKEVDEFARVVYNNILDVPLVLFILYINSSLPAMRNFTRLLIPVYMFVELMNGFFRGFNDASFKYLLGGGVLLIIVLVIIEVINYFQKMDNTDREKAKSFLYLAILFEYASYVIVYIFTYFVVPVNDDHTDNLIIYYSSTVIGIAISCFGFASPYLNKKVPVPVPREHEVLISILD